MATLCNMTIDASAMYRNSNYFKCILIGGDSTGNADSSMFNNCRFVNSFVGVSIENCTFIGCVFLDNQSLDPETRKTCTFVNCAVEQGPAFQENTHHALQRQLPLQEDIEMSDDDDDDEKDEKRPRKKIKSHLFVYFSNIVVPNIQSSHTLP